MISTTEDLTARLAKLQAVDPMEIGGRAGDVAALIQVVLELRTENEQLKRRWNQMDSELSSAREKLEYATNYAICGYCRSEIPKEASVMLAHLESCEAHPLHKIMAAMDGLHRDVCAAAATSFETLHSEYLAWVKDTFPNETAVEQFDHLKEEFSELSDDLSTPVEYADVLMLLCCVAHANRVDIFRAFRDKFEVNKARKWQKTERGYRHVKSDSGGGEIRPAKHVGCPPNTDQPSEGSVLTLSDGAGACIHEQEDPSRISARPAVAPCNDDKLNGK